MEQTKGQAMRLIDVFAIGPFMIYGGAKKSNLRKGLRAGLVLIGIGTILYNGRNYLINTERERNAPQGNK